MFVAYGERYGMRESAQCAFTSDIVRSRTAAGSRLLLPNRLTVRSSVNRYVRKVAPSGPKPWDDDVA